MEVDISIQLATASAVTVFLGGISSSNPVNFISEDAEDATQRPIDKYNLFSIDKVEKILLPILKTNIVPFIWGPPGVGKSELVKKICKSNGWELIDLRLSLLNPVDLRGIPTIHHRQKQAEWYPPTFLPHFKTKKAGILFLDEINLAPLSVQAAAYQLILDKRVGEYIFPSSWRIIAAGNREIDRANVYKLSAPLANRFIHFEITPDIRAWLKWAKENKIQKEIIDFLTLRPVLLFRMPTDSEKSFPSPRMWKFLSDLFVSFNYKNSVSEDFKKIIVATIGSKVGQEFIQFLESDEIKLVSEKIKEFIKTGKIIMPKKISLRDALIEAIAAHFNSKKVNKKLLEEFTKKLNAEEKEKIKLLVNRNYTLDILEEENE